MITKQTLLSDIQLQILQAAPSDDSELELDQIAFWVSNDLNALVATEINSKTARGEMVPSIYIKRATCEASSIENNLCGNEDRIFVEINEDILTLNNDAGVVLVQTDGGDQVKKITIETLILFRNMRFAKASDSNLQYYRQGKKFYLEGLKNSDVPFESLDIFYVPKQDVMVLAATDEVLVSDLVIPTLIDSVVQRGKAMLLGSVPEDVDNDGATHISPLYHKQIANPDQQPTE
jgi:hypothetical protein